MDFVIEGGVLKKYKDESRDVVIPDGVREIEGGAFYGLAIESVVIPNSVIKIRNANHNTAYKGAFSQCKYLKKVILSEHIIEIRAESFSGCTSLVDIKIPNSMTKIKGLAFRECTSLSFVHLPESVTEIGSAAFEGCTSLITINIPQNIRSISCFSNCISLRSIKIPDKLEEIGYETFKNCTSLQSIVIPSNVKNIDGCSAFYGCTALSEATVLGDKRLESCFGFTPYGRKKEGCCMHCGGQFKGLIQKNALAVASTKIIKIKFRKS